MKKMPLEGGVASTVCDCDVLGPFHYDVHPDERFLMLVSDEEAQEFRVVLNWFDELKRLVPVD